MAAVTVLIPVRDAADTLDEALESVVAQSFGDLEILLVDDGSTDGTPRRLRAWQGRDRRVRVLPNAGAGLVDALRTGLDAARSELVARFDADDVMAPARIGRQLAALAADPGLAGVGAHVRLFPDALVTDGMRRYERWLASVRGTPDDPWGAQAVAREAFIECPLAHPTWLVRREVLAAVGYRDDGLPEDHDLLLRMLDSDHRLGVVPEVLHHWREGPGRHSRSHPRYGAARFLAARADALVRGPLAGGDRYLLWGHGPTGRRLRAALAERGRRAALVVEVHPRRIGQVIGGAPVVSPEQLVAATTAAGSREPAGEHGGVAALRDGGRRLPLVAAVSGAEARGRIRDHLARAGWEEGADFVVAA